MSENANLQGLYPFLHGKKQDPAAMNSALVETVRQKARHHHDVIDDFFAKNGQRVVAAAGAIADVYRRDGRLFAMGNGGSSCDAAHVAVEFLHPITTGRPALTAVDLSADRHEVQASPRVGGSHHAGQLPVLLGEHFPKQKARGQRTDAGRGDADAKGSEHRGARPAQIPEIDRQEQPDDRHRNDWPLDKIVHRGSRSQDGKIRRKSP